MPDLDSLDGAILQPGDLLEETLDGTPQREVTQARFRARAIIGIELHFDEDTWRRAELRLAIADLQFLDPAEVDGLEQPHEPRALRRKVMKCGRADHAALSPIRPRLRARNSSTAG